MKVAYSVGIPLTAKNSPTFLLNIFWNRFI